MTRRPPFGVTLFGVMLLAGSVGLTWWWYRQHRPTNASAPTAEQLDVYCSGRVDAAGQVVALEPTTAGRVTAVRVREGESVSPDQPLLALDDTPQAHQVSQAEAALTLAELELAQAERAEARFPLQLAARAAGAKAAEFRVESARQSLAQRKVAANSGPPLGPEELAGLEAQIAALEELAAAEQANLRDAESLRPEYAGRIAAARARLTSAGADLAAARKAQADMVLRAPAAGTVLRLQATVGGIVGPGTPLPPVVFAPAGDAIVRAEIDQEAVAEVREGMTAEVRDENRPDGPVWRGRVRSLAGWIAQKRSAVLEPGEIGDVRTVECVIDLEPGGERLWIGQRMRVRIRTSSDGRDR